MVTKEQLAKKYPLLWHMADLRNIDGILRRGLLATSTLLDVLEVEQAARTQYERERRPDDVVLENRKHGRIVLRDQRPLSTTRLRSALTHGTVEDFLQFINGRVFFWPTIQRLRTMNGARAYHDRMQAVFVIRSSELIEQYEAKLRLSRINSGATMPYAAPRSIETFRRLCDYEWTTGKQNVAELTIEIGVPNIWDFVERLELWQNSERIAIVDRPYDHSLQKRIDEMR